MVAIPSKLGEGGSGLSPRGNGPVSLVAILLSMLADITALVGEAPDDLPEPDAPPAVAQAAPAAVSAPSTVSQAAPAALGAFTDPPSVPEMAALRSAVNDINTRLTQGLARLDGAVATVAALNSLNTRVTEVLARLDGVYAVVTALSGAVEDLHALETARAEVELETTVGT